MKIRGLPPFSFKQSFFPEVGNPLRRNNYKEDIKMVETTEQKVMTETQGKVAETLPDAKTLQAELAQSKTQLVELNTKLKTVEDNWKNEQRNSSKKNEEIQKLRDLRSEVDTLKEYVKIQTAVLAELKGQSESEYTTETQTNKSDYLKKFTDLEANLKQKRDLEVLQTRALEFKARVDTLGLKEDSEDYLDIHDLVVEGKFARADLKLKKLESKETLKETKEVKPEDKKPELTKEDKEKIALDYAKEKGWLKSEDGQPSASGGDDLNKLSSKELLNMGYSKKK